MVSDSLAAELLGSQGIKGKTVEVRGDPVHEALGIFVKGDEDALVLAFFFRDKRGRRQGMKSWVVCDKDAPLR